LEGEHAGEDGSGETEKIDEYSDEILKEGETSKGTGTVSFSDLAVEYDDDNGGGRLRCAAARKGCEKSTTTDTRKLIKLHQHRRLLELYSNVFPTPFSSGNLMAYFIPGRSNDAGITQLL